MDLAAESNLQATPEERFVYSLFLQHTAQCVGK